MTYSIFLTNGTALTSITDGSVDNTTDLTLIGKNVSGYGNYINENFLHLLENFSNSSAPNNPIQGQLWFDTSVNRLKVYNGTQFVVSGGSIVSSTLPSSIATGDLWIDNVREQLYFNDGISTLLAGPLYTASQGVSGFTVEDHLDTNQISHTVVLLWLSQQLLGVFTKESFTFAEPPAGIPATVGVGFTCSSITNFRFNVPTTSAYNLIAATGALKTAESFISTTGDSQSTGTLSIQNSTPLKLGPAANTEFDVNSSVFEIKSNTANQNFLIQLLNASGTHPALFINSQSQYVGLFTQSPQATLDVAGDVIVEGNLTVKGGTSTISSTVITLADKNIELNKVDTPTDTLANGGGFTLHGTTDKTFTWAYDGSGGSWNSSEGINLVSGQTYKIGGFDVLTPTSLGLGITSANGITSIGRLASLRTTNIEINSNIISYYNALQPNGNIVLQPKGVGVIDVNSTKIINLATPTLSTDAANKSYVDNTLQTSSVAITLTANGLSNTQLAANYLAKIFPNTEHQSGTLCRVFVTDDSTVRQFQLTGSPLIWTFQYNL
jgi:hypothetical protein